MSLASRYIAAFSSATPISTIISATIVNFSSSFIPESLLSYAFAFSTGTFLHVALMHILPSIGHHTIVWHYLVILLGALVPYLFFVSHKH